MSSPARILTEAPRRLTAALDKALRNCPQPTYFGEYQYSTHAQREQISQLLAVRYLTELEFKWVLLKRVYFDVETADKVIEQLAAIIDYRRASGAPPAPNSFGCYFPEKNPKPGQARPSRP